MVFNWRKISKKEPPWEEQCPLFPKPLRLHITQKWTLIKTKEISSGHNTKLPHKDTLPTLKLKLIKPKEINFGNKIKSKKLETLHTQKSMLIPKSATNFGLNNNKLELELVITPLLM
jgi:hypothetical protein